VVQPLRVFYGASARIAAFSIGPAFAGILRMDNKTYLLRAFSTALLLWGSVAVVVFVAQRPAADGASASSDPVALSK
jgi:hypothetical protein